MCSEEGGSALIINDMARVARRSGLLAQSKPKKKKKTRTQAMILELRPDGTVKKLK